MNFSDDKAPGEPHYWIMVCPQGKVRNLCTAESAVVARGMMNFWYYRPHGYQITEVTKKEEYDGYCREFGTGR